MENFFNVALGTQSYVTIAFVDLTFSINLLSNLFTFFGMEERSAELPTCCTNNCLLRIPKEEMSQAQLDCKYTQTLGWKARKTARNNSTC